MDTNALLYNLPLSTMLGTPVKACIEAQELAARSSRDYLEQVVMQRDRFGRLEAVMISFSYVLSGQRLLMTLPLITIIPVPFFAINTLDIAFDAVVTDLDQDRMLCTYSYTSVGKTNETDVRLATQSDLHISLHASQSNIPIGLSRLLSLLDQSVQEKMFIDPRQYEKSEISLSHTRLEMLIGQRQRLHAMNDSATLQGIWRSSAPELFDIDTNGWIEAHRAGHGFVVYETEREQAFCDVIVHTAESTTLDPSHLIYTGSGGTMSAPDHGKSSSVGQGALETLRVDVMGSVMEQSKAVSQTFDSTRDEDHTVADQRASNFPSSPTGGRPSRPSKIEPEVRRYLSRLIPTLTSRSKKKRPIR